MDGGESFLGVLVLSSVPPNTVGSSAAPKVDRNVVFISKATPGDDEFALWLAPKLEAEGYTVFADILSLDAGTRWRSEVTKTLQERSIKTLLCCRDSTLASDGVQEEIGIALDLVKELKDPKFIIPLRLEPFKKLFGIGELQYVDFVRGWAEGLNKLLTQLKRLKVPCDPNNLQISPNWEIFRRRGAIQIKKEPERLTSNWLRIVEVPDHIRFFVPSGAVNPFALNEACTSSQYPVVARDLGFVAVGTETEINERFSMTGRFKATHEFNLTAFIENGAEELNLKGKDASNIVNSMFRQAWNNFCRSRGLLEYHYSKAAGFHISQAQAKLGQKVPWGKQGDRRSSMLRNVARGRVWQFGVSALPAYWPFPHFKLKSRVLFAPQRGDEAAEPYDDVKKQHRLRRSVCKGWRNKQWHGRIMAFLELLSADSSFLRFPLSPSAAIVVDASPVLFTSPLSTYLPDTMRDEDEETDTSTLGRPEPEDDDD
jgi:hypothetical protein